MKITLIIHDHDSTVNDFPLGAGYLVSVLRQNGFPDEYIHIYNMDVYHYSDEDLRDYLVTSEFDLIGIGMIAGYWQYRQLKRIMDVINSLAKRPVVVLGGFMFTPDPAYFMRKFSVDYVVMGEGEYIFSELVTALGNRKSIDKIPGLAYWSGSEIIINSRRPPLKDIDQLPFPAWDKFPINAYVPKVRIPIGGAQRSLPVLSSRGCLYKCAFCYRMEPGYRQRSLESVLEECRILVKDYHLNAICFRDELLMSTPDRAMEFAEAILKSGMNIHFDIDGRLNAARPEALKLLKQAGCVYINYGVESLDQTVLNNLNKKQTIPEIISGVEETIKAGIHPGLNVIWGAPGDNAETADKIVKFLNKYNTYGELRTLKPVTPYPGSPLYDLAVEKGFIKDIADFYETKHLNSDLITCNFTDLETTQLHQILYDANKRLLKDHFDHLYERNLKAHQKLYFESDVNFRGVRH
jgi:anaerobic magnesium-protoporphyrin IX monomethyl ester cyclase